MNILPWLKSWKPRRICAGAISFKERGFSLEWNALSKSVRYFGPVHDYYDGDFYKFGFWWFHVYITTNPHTYLTKEEITANIERFKREHPEIKI